MASFVDRRFGIAWLLFVLSLALHVTDEATHDFLSFYNPNALMIRERFHIPLPVFSFETWIASLAVGIAVLLCLSPLAFRGARSLRIVAVPLAVIVGILNAAGHISSSIYYHRFMPGVYSSPFLAAGAIFLLHAAFRRHRAALAAAA